MLTNDDLNRVEELSVFRSENDGELIRELVKMARRYLWLRDEAALATGRAPMVLNVECIPQATWRDQLQGEQLDAAIDAASSKQKSP